MPKSIFPNSMLTKNSQLENFEKLKLKIQYNHENPSSFIAVKTKNEAIIIVF